MAAARYVQRFMTWPFDRKRSFPPSRDYLKTQLSTLVS